MFVFRELVAPLALLLVGWGATPTRTEGPSASATASQDTGRVVRAVPQIGWLAPGRQNSFVGIVPGDRYAVARADDVTLVVDLDARRVAHRLSGEVRRAGPHRHHVTLWMSSPQSGGILDLVSGRWACRGEHGDQVMDGLVSGDGRTCVLVVRSAARRSELVLTTTDPTKTGPGHTVAERIRLPEPPGDALSVELANDLDGPPGLLLRGSRGCPACRRSTPLEVFELAVSRTSGRPAQNTGWRSVDAPTLRPSNGNLPFERLRPATTAEAARVAQTIAGLPPTAGLPCVVASDDLRTAITVGRHGARLAAWSIVDGTRTAVLSTPAGAVFDQAAGFLDDRTILVMGEPMTEASGAARASIGVWHLDTGKVEHRTFRPVSSPILPSPTGRRFIVQRPAPDRAWPFEVWTLGGDRADWVNRGAAGMIGWSDDGQRVLHQEGSGPIDARDATSGRPIPPDARDQTVIGIFAGLRVNLAARPARYRLGDNGAVPSLETDSGDTIVSFLDFADGEWIAFTPDGPYTGSASVRRHVTWFHTDGSLATEADVAALRRPELLKQRLAEIFAPP